MIRIEDRNEILSLLYEFDAVFIHNREKVADYDAWAEKIHANGYVYVLKKLDKIAGMSVFYANDFDNGVGYISLIGLKPEYRGRGMGKRFIIEIFRKMKELGMRYCMLEVDNDNEAILFYKNIGFVVCENRTKSKLLKYTF